MFAYQTTLRQNPDDHDLKDANHVNSKIYIITFIVAMSGNHIQRVKIVINENIIEQVTYFKYLGYSISEYKSDVEDKLQTYNKINGAIRRHFGKQMNKEKN